MIQLLTSNLLGFLFVVGLVIFFHEGGHFLAAKAFGVRVRTFSLGFGKRLWGFRRGDTDYRLSLVPLGGYVSFFGQDPSDPTDDPGAFLNHPRWQRILILLAGPAMNVVLAIVLVAGLFVAGTEYGGQRGLGTQVGYVRDGGPAAQAGLRTGDRILELDGEAVTDWQKISMAVLTSPGQPIELLVERDGEQVSTTLVPITIPRWQLGEGGFEPALPVRVRSVIKDSAADRAGLRYGDALLAVDDRPVATLEDFSRYVSPLAGKEVAILVERDGERFLVRATPELREGRGTIGVTISPFSFHRFGPVRAFQESLRYNWESTVDLFVFVGKIFERRISVESAFGGPLTIAEFSGEAARRSFRDLLLLVAMISLNLALLNMLPIPILDGGQITVLAVESTLRRDLSLRMKELMAVMGLCVIVSLMLMALYFDVKRKLPVSEEPAAVEAP